MSIRSLILCVPIRGARLYVPEPGTDVPYDRRQLSSPRWFSCLSLR
jgi:hypothetical protein